MVGGAAECIVPTSGPLAAPEPRPDDPEITPEQLAKIASDKAISMADPPSLELAPGAAGLTGLPTYFWLEESPRPVVATAQVPGLLVTARAEPVQYSWDFGDGSSVVTTDIGRRWTRSRPGSIKHTYETRGRYELTVQAIWRGRWQVNGGAWRELGYFVTTDRLSYPVRQMRPVLTRSRR
jgi:hypothetical protein